MDKKEQEIRVLIEYFKSLREEIHIRIREHTRLVWIKIISLGAIISFLMERFYVSGVTVGGESSTSYLLCIVWIIPLAAVIFDMLIAGNLRDINNLGHYIKKYFDEKAFRGYVDVPEFHFWEEVAGQASPEYRCYTKEDMVVIWLFTLASGVFSGLLRCQLGFIWVDAILAIICAIGVVFALRYLIRSISMKREFHLYPKIGNVRNIEWKIVKVTKWGKVKRWIKARHRGVKKGKIKGTILESKPSLRTSGYKMKALYIPPNTIYELGSGEFIICLLRGNIISKGYHLPLRKSLIVKNFLFKSGEDGCLLFVCKDEGDNNKYFDDISGLEIGWSEYDTNMYRTIPQIHVGGYRINLWYLGPNKHGGIHNHAAEQVPFIEFHTQLRGNGWMVKYEDKEGKKELERIKMERGDTHDLFCIVKDKKVVYPWHEYIAGGSGSLFMVFEDTRR